MIYQTESVKLWKHPMIWGLLLMFFALNAWSVFSELGWYGKDAWQEMHQRSRDGTWDAEVVGYADELYEDLNMNGIKEMKELHSNYEPKGAFRDFVDECYRFFDGRVKEITASGQDSGNYYPGASIEIHNYLYGTLLCNVWLEMAVLVICVTLFLMDYERIFKTSDLVYSSVKGRRLQLGKMCLGLFYGMAAGILLLVATLLLFFWVVPMEGLWDVPMTAALVANARVVWLYPFITYTSMTVKEYLLASLLLGTVMALGVGILAGVVQLLMRNSYFSITTLLVLLLGGYVASGVSTGTFVDVFCRMNPSALWSRCSTWFMEWDLVMCFQGNEVLSLILQYLVYGVGLVLGIHLWRKADL